jgi:hypothetical protein
LERKRELKPYIIIRIKISLEHEWRKSDFIYAYFMGNGFISLLKWSPNIWFPIIYLLGILWYELTNVSH